MAPQWIITMASAHLETFKYKWDGETDWAAVSSFAHNWISIENQLQIKCNQDEKLWRPHKSSSRGGGSIRRPGAICWKPGL